VVTEVVRPEPDAFVRHADSRSVRAELQRVVDLLLEEYRGVVPAGSVIRCVARCTEIATRTGVPRPALAPAVERMARATLDGRSQAGPPSLHSLEPWPRGDLGVGQIPAQPAGPRDESCVSG
jgi:hypothetical protein